MDKDILNHYIEAGKIASEALQYGKKLIKPGASMNEVCNKVEDKVHDLGGELAFPTQIACNEVAAHFASTEADDIIFKDQLCCLDVGAQVNGYIGDNALTVDLSGKYKELVNASREALNNALKIIKPGVTLAEIGTAIETTILEKGFVPVRNLSGHGVDQYEAHTAPSIPNFNTGEQTPLEEGQVIAVEPFASTGAGLIEERGEPTVFEIVGAKPVRSQFARQLLREIDPDLPFTMRQLTRTLSIPKIKFALREFRQLDILKEYPPLVDKENGMVSQAEHTVIVQDKPIITTKQN